MLKFAVWQYIYEFWHMLERILNSIQVESILSALVVTASYGQLPPYTVK